ncbi:hypothetical protein RCL1_000154 [Eukaryota sp. TZLM3-RCL]
MQLIENQFPRAYKILSELPFEHWAEPFVTCDRYGHYTNNVCESLNAWIVEARKLPVCQMLTRIVEQLSEWFEERRASAETMKGQFVDSIEEE